MVDLLWPGDERAGDLLDDAALLTAMVAVEDAWLGGLVDHALAPTSARADLTGLVGFADVDRVAAEAEATGTPVVALLALLRERLGEDQPEAARWLHRGLTSQDVLDTALLMCAREAARRVGDDLDTQVRTLAALAERHRGTPMVGRTLTQHAVPMTFGLKVAGWLRGVLHARDRLATTTHALPVQVGGAVGSLAAGTALAALRDRPDPAATAADLASALAERLGLAPAPPWHTERGAVTDLGDALVGCADAWGRIAADVTTLVRPEIGELRAPAGGGSSTMPHKQNPVLAVLLRRTAIAAPPLAATLHTAAALAVDERPDGAWHVEAATLRTLGRRTVVAASQATALLTGLEVDTDRMADNLAAAGDAVLSEQRAVADLLDAGPPPRHVDAADAIIDATLAAAAAPEETS